MGRAMQLPGNNETLNRHPELTFRRGQYLYAVKTHNGHTEYTVSDGTQSITIPILWAMGAQAQTWVLEHNGQMYESMVSYYPTIPGLDVTVGDDQLHPTSLEEAIGRPLDKEGVSTCFGCHATNAVIDHKLNLTAFTPGVKCEHCHVGADAHLAAMVQGDTTVIPPDLKKLSSEDISNFCGQCHRTWELVTRAGWRGPSNVRFQPYRLALSKCFDGTDPRISCIACHDPHVEVARDSSYYDKKCLACHSPAMSAAPPYAKVCPVAKSNCASCHMPKVPFPGGHFIFTDHDIRVVKPNEPYPY
ncbi:MAG: multiheme c-type cytochrome [Silvibacterium sp.]